jgi:hypothetical protein
METKMASALNSLQAMLARGDLSLISQPLVDPLKEAFDFMTATSLACKAVISCDDPANGVEQLPDMSEVAQEVGFQTIAARGITTVCQILFF